MACLQQLQTDAGENLVQGGEQLKVEPSSHQHLSAKTRMARKHWQTGCELREQCEGEYISKALPFTETRPIAGPSFFPKAAAREAGAMDGKPFLTVTAHMMMSTLRNGREGRWCTSGAFLMTPLMSP